MQKDCQITVHNLTTSANQQTASLEETAAAIEEITQIYKIVLKIL